MRCSICPRRCGAERTEAEGHGFCRMPAAPVVARAALHPWEEPVLCGSGGAGTVFFSGCNLGCVYCQNHVISAENYGKIITVERLREIFGELIRQGAQTVELVTATHFVPFILPALERPLPVPLVYNCGGYESLDTLKMLEGLVDIYLPDFKYADSALAAEYSHAPDYFERASEAIKEMNRQVGVLKLDSDGIAERGLIIRHLVLPGAVSNTKKVLRWIKENLPEGTVVSLMSQYTPCAKAAEHPPLDRRISKYEYEIALDAMIDLGFDNGYVQSRRSAQKDFIPDFQSHEGLL